MFQETKMATPTICMDKATALYAYIGVSGADRARLEAQLQPLLGCTMWEYLESRQLLLIDDACFLVQSVESVAPNLRCRLSTYLQAYYCFISFLDGNCKGCERACLVPFSKIVARKDHYGFGGCLEECEACFYGNSVGHLCNQ